MKVCVIEFPSDSRQHELHLNQFLRILASTRAKVSVVTGNLKVPSDITIHQFSISDTQFGRGTFLKRVTRYIILQLRMCLRLMQVSKSVESVISFHDYVSNSASIILAKILGKRVGIYVGGSPSRNIAQCYRGLRGLILYYIVLAIEHLLLQICDLIIPLSRSMIDYQGLNKYNTRISKVDGARYIDSAVFSGRVPSNERENIVAYVGRLSPEKGIMNFLSAIPQILRDSNATIWIFGGGDLETIVINHINQLNNPKKITFYGFVTHEQIIKKLNQIKVLVVPSYSEGLPTIILESLASGVIVISSSVGGIPDLIKDGITGFILESTSPSVISRAVKQVLESPSLLQVKQNGYQLVQQKFTFENAVHRWESIIKRLHKM